VHFGNAQWASCGSVMSGNDDVIKEAAAFIKEAAAFSFARGTCGEVK
jgi:hypothetical protein